MTESEKKRGIVGTGTPFFNSRWNFEYLPSGFFSIRLNEAIPIIDERGERDLLRLFYTYM